MSLERHPLYRLFYPRNVAIIGASGRSGSYGGGALPYLMRHGFQGKIFPINPNYEEIEGLQAFPSVLDISEPIDLALVLIGDARVFDALKACEKKGIPFVSVFSNNLTEPGEGFQDRLKGISQWIRESAVHVNGPNCIGIINTHYPMALSAGTSLRMERLIPGHIGIAAQSGGTLMAMFNRAQDRGIGFSYLVSTGNEVDLEAADFLDFMLEDDQTMAIAGFIETSILEGHF